MTDTIHDLSESRKAIVSEMREIAEKAHSFNRELSSGEQTRFNALNFEADLLEQRINQLRGAEGRALDTQAKFAELAARPVDRGYSADDGTADEFRRIVRTNSREPIEVRDSNPKSMYQPGLERRDLLKTAPTGFTPTSMHNQIVEHMVETSAVLRAGATVLTTTSGEDLLVPRSTALSTASIITEGSAITESDPTLSSVTLKSYKYAILIQASRELIEDTNVDLQGYLARETGTAIGLALGNHLINGTGTGQPRGVLADTTAGVTGPTGTSTSLGAQGTAGQGTDLLNSLVGSLAEPYALSSSAAFLLRSASLTSVRNLKTTAGDLVGSSYINGSGYPFLIDPNVPAMAANAKSVLFGDWSRYFVRIVNGVRFERSDDFAFNTDLVTFRAILRADGALINTDAIKHFANSAT